MRLIVGLGNPGEKYEKTRHNVGFMFVDFVLSSRNLKPGDGKQLKDSFVYKLNDLIFAKPLTLMNESGRAVKELAKWYDFNIENNLVIVHDDLDIALGKHKFQFAKSPKAHNGIISVENHLGTTKFHRLRIGVENRTSKKIPGHDYVLQNFTSEELQLLGETFSSIDINSLIRS